MAYGPEAGLRLVDEIADAAALRDYAPLPAARGDFLFRAGRLAEARSEFTAAATLTRNARERAFLLARADACRLQALNTVSEAPLPRSAPGPLLTDFRVLVRRPDDPTMSSRQVTR
jgi:hypothetical protein